jgi:hypothetical protein
VGIEYRLTLASDIPLEDIAPLVAAHGVEESTQPNYPRLLSADLREELGYTVTIYAGSNGYFDAEDDDGIQWEWEPDTYTNVVFDLRKNDPPDDVVPTMVSAVGRVLASRQEDAALVLNGNWLLLTRVGGELRRHRPTWWSHYGIDDLIITQ